MDDSKKVLHLQSAQNRLLIKNGMVINHDESKFVDVYIEDSIIKQVGNHLIIPGGTRCIDALGNIFLSKRFHVKKITRFLIIIRKVSHSWRHRSQCSFSKPGTNSWNKCTQWNTYHWRLLFWNQSCTQRWHYDHHWHDQTGPRWIFAESLWKMATMGWRSSLLWFCIQSQDF